MTDRRVLFGLLEMFLFVCGPAYSINYEEIGTDSASRLLADQQYQEASNLLWNIAAQNPDDVQALYLLLVARQTEILDYESYVIFGDRFIAFADSVYFVMTEKLSSLKGNDSLDCLFYLANTIGGIAIVEGKRGNWFSAVKYALRSVAQLKTVREIDSTYYAAYLGIGVFDYYLSQNLKWLPFFGDRTEQALEYLKRATDARFPYNIAAKNSLCWILIERNQFHKADSICMTVLNDYPENTVFIRIEACIALWTQQWENALYWGKRLIELSRKRNPVNWSDLMTGYWIAIEAYQKLDMYNECVACADEALKLNIPLPYSKIIYVQDNKKKIQKIRTDCEKKP